VHHRPHLTAGAYALAALTLTLAACSSGPQPAPDAGDPACTRALAEAPSTVLGKPRTPLDVRGALAWGDPQIVLRCGLPALGPTTSQCLEVNGVDWVVADPDADPVVFTLFGRNPAVDLSVPASYGRSSASAALVDVAAVAQTLPQNGHSCS
jgi:Protein of unknown function (DUF3515)